MLLPDVNVVLAGFRAEHDHHRPARAFLDLARSASEVLGLSDFALGSVLRLATSTRAFLRPDTAESVIDYLEVLLEPPGQLVRAGATQWPRFIEFACT